MFRRSLLLTLVLSSVLIVPTQHREAGAAMRVRWGYYTGYDKATSLPSLRAHVSDLNYVSPWYGYSINATGKLSGSNDPEATGIARSAGARVLPLVQNGARYGAFHKLIASPTARRGMVQAISGMVKANGFQGVNVDFEGITPTDRPYLTRFMAELYANMHARRKLVTMAVPAKTHDTTTGWGGAYDYAGLAPHADFFVIMAYDFHFPGGDPGPIAPVTWVRSAAAYALSQFGARKLIVGLGLYGYDWNVTTGAKATSVRFPQIADLRRTYRATLGYDRVSESATAKYTKSGQAHRVWYETGRSFDAKMAALRTLGVTGVAVWRLGQEDRRIWNSMRGLSIGRSTSTFSPNADGYQDSVAVSYRSDSPATVGVQVLDADGRVVRVLQPAKSMSAGVRALTWNGKGGAGNTLVDGRYTVRVTATISGSPVSDTSHLWINTSLKRLTVSPGVFSPNRGGLTAGYTITRPARVTVAVTQGSRTVRGLVARATQPAGAYTVRWNGRTSSGAILPEGGYSIQAIAESSAGRSLIIRDLYLDRRPPELTNARLSNASFYANGATTQTWSYYLSENASVQLNVLRSGQVVQTIKMPARRAGRHSASWNGYVGGAAAPAGAYSYRLVATDTAANTSRVVTGQFTVVR